MINLRRIVSPGWASLTSAEVVVKRMVASTGSVLSFSSSSSSSFASPPSGFKQKFTILITNVSPDAQWFHVKDLLKPQNVRHVQQLSHSNTRYLAKFDSPDDASAAMSAHHGVNFMGSTLHIAPGEKDLEKFGGSNRERGERPTSSGGGSRTMVVNTTQVYVGNLAYETTEAALKEHLSQVGEVVSVNIMKSMDGGSKGCALVRFADKDTANRAISELQDTRMDGRLLFLREDRDAERLTAQQRISESYNTANRLSRGASPTTSDNGLENSTDENYADRQVYITGLPYEMNWIHLKKYCNDNIGDVQYAQIYTNDKGFSKGCGIVLFRSAEHAKAAVERMNNTYMLNRFIAVRMHNKDYKKERETAPESA